MPADRGLVTPGRRPGQRRRRTEGGDVVERGLGQVDVRLERHPDRLAQALDLSQQCHQVVGGDDGGGVVHGAVGVGHLEPSTAQGTHDIVGQPVAGDGEPGTGQAPGAECRGGQRHQRVNGRPPPVGGQHAEAEGPRQVRHDGARHRLDGQGHLADAGVGGRDHQQVDAPGRRGQIIASTKQGRDVPAGGGEGLGQRRAGSAGTDDPQPHHDYEAASSSSAPTGST